ncbi:MAG: hypothetical protein ACXWNJ_10445 [Vulcanimicrobiaceae bacterium]
MTDSEDFSRTSHHRLFIAKQDRLEYARLGKGVEQLQRAVHAGDWRTAISSLQQFVPEFKPGPHLLEGGKVTRPIPLPIRVEHAEVEVDRGSADTQELIASPSSAQ